MRLADGEMMRGCGKKGRNETEKKKNTPINNACSLLGLLITSKIIHHLPFSPHGLCLLCKAFIKNVLARDFHTEQNEDKRSDCHQC